MQVQSRITFLRDVGRFDEQLVERSVEVSGDVLETPDEYLVELDPAHDLETPAEREQAEQALIATYEASRRA